MDVRDRMQGFMAEALPPEPGDPEEAFRRGRRRARLRRVGTAGGLAVAGVVALAAVLSVLPGSVGQRLPVIGDASEERGESVDDRAVVFAGGEIPSGEWTARTWLREADDRHAVCVEVRHGVARDLDCRLPIPPGEVMSVGPSGFVGDDADRLRPSAAVLGQVTSDVARVRVLLDDGSRVSLEPHELPLEGRSVVGHAFPADRHPAEVHALSHDGQVMKRHVITHPDMGARD